MRDKHGKPVRPAEEKPLAKAGELVHMERTKEEKKNTEALSPSSESGPDYPYGLRLHLDHDCLKKVGLHETPEVGHEVHIRAKAHVVAAREEKREGDEPERHLELQITHLGIHPKADGFKDEDQGGTGKAGAGHVTEKREASTRKRH